MGASDAKIDGFVGEEAEKSVGASPFDCVIPLKVYGALRTLKPNSRVDTYTI